MATYELKLTLTIDVEKYSKTEAVWDTIKKLSEAGLPQPDTLVCYKKGGK